MTWSYIPFANVDQCLVPVALSSGSGFVPYVVSDVASVVAPEIVSDDVTVVVPEVASVDVSAVVSDNKSGVGPEVGLGW